MFNAFHLPALPAPPTVVWPYGQEAERVELRLPQLSPDLLRRQIAFLRDVGGKALSRRSVGEIVRAVDRIARRLGDPADDLRKSAEALLPSVTGYSPETIQVGLDHMAADWTAERLWRLLRAEFVDPEVLDGFRPRPEGGGKTRGYGPGLSLHVFSGNVPGVAVTSIIRSLLVKSPVLGKSAAGEPVLPALFARALAEEDPELGAAVAIAYWRGGDERLEEVALESADAVVVYGGEEAIRSLRARAPARARFIGYGHKLSFGLVAREVLDSSRGVEIAELAAREVATFDQQGCVTPHLFYVESGGETTPRTWARELAAALERVEEELPRGRISRGEASAIRQLRGEAEFQQIGGSGVELHASRRGTAWTVVYDPDPTFQASCLNRTVRVKPLNDLSEAEERLARMGPLLQSVGIAAGAQRREELAERLGRLGASRVAAIGGMAWPPPWWHHDGAPPLRTLVRWCDLES